MQYSNHVIILVMNFMKEMQIELGEISDAKVEAMLDAFDPSLRKQILMHVLKGDLMGNIKVRFDPNFKSPQKITFIKEFRALTGHGLKESKDFSDAVGQTGTGIIPGVFEYEKRRNFARNIAGTGYEVI